MPTIPGFWDQGPHDPIPVESTWTDFIREIGGSVVEDISPAPRNFENADFLFLNLGVCAELKEIETEFSNSKAFVSGFSKLMNRVVAEDPTWRPLLFGGSGSYPAWFQFEFLRLFRPPVSRVLKKANKQLRETKAHFGITSATGVLLLVNDGFTSISPQLIQALSSDLLIHSYSSIDCCVYLTVNRYIELAGSNTPRLLWSPLYSTRAPDSLVAFIDDLGRKWFEHLELKIGPFTS